MNKAELVSKMAEKSELELTKKQIEANLRNKIAKSNNEKYDFLQERFNNVSKQLYDARKRIIEADLVEGIVALPPQLFYSVTIPVTLWFICKNKKQIGKTIFIDARMMGFLLNR